MSKIKEKLFFEFMKVISVAAGDSIQDADIQEAIELIRTAAAEGDEDSRREMEAITAVFMGVFEALLPMPDEVGAAISAAFHEAVEGEYSLDVHACETVWKAAIEAILK